MFTEIFAKFKLINSDATEMHGRRAWLGKRPGLIRYPYYYLLCLDGRSPEAYGVGLNDKESSSLVPRPHLPQPGEGGLVTFIRFL